MKKRKWLGATYISKKAKQKLSREENPEKALQLRNNLYLKQLRIKATPAELVFGDFLYEQGIPFIFQKGYFRPFHRILDFYLKGLNVGIELDGSSHYGKEIKDQRKDDWFWNERKIRIIRFSNREIFNGEFKPILQNILKGQLPKAIKLSYNKYYKKPTKFDYAGYRKKKEKKLRKAIDKQQSERESILKRREFKLKVIHLR